MSRISERIARVNENIGSACARVGRDPAKIKLVVVTKSTDLNAIRQVVELGCSDLGENRVQQLKKVAAELADLFHSQTPHANPASNIRWHMIGHLQRNKVRQVLSLISLVHSVDTLRLAEEIDASAQKLDIKSEILLQVNTSGEPQKYGVPVGAAIHMAEQFQTLANVKLIGLMTMAPLTHNKDLVRTSFSQAREIFLEIKGEKIAGPEFTQLSMGMSSDYEIAVEEGATILRIGSAIFA
jgi:hypothetical protein